MEHVLAQDHRRAIIAAAIRVMAAEGVPAASTRRVAAEAGVPQSTIHYVFGTKAVLYRAVMESVAARLVRAIGDVSSAAPWDEQVRASYEAVWEVVAADPSAALLVIELTTWAVRQPGFADLAAELHGAYRHAAEDSVRRFRASTDRTFRLSVEDLAAMSVSAINGLIMTFIVHGDRARARRELGHFVSALTELDFAGDALSG